MAKKRIPYVDAAKGVAILLVVAAHLLIENDALFAGERNIALKGLIYSFHMPFFFFITGFCCYAISYSSEIDFRYIKTKIVKSITTLLPCYFLWTGIYFFLHSLSKEPNLKDWLLVLLSFRGKAPLWFLGALLLGKIAFFLLQYIFKKRIPCYLITVLICAIVTVPCHRQMLELATNENTSPITLYLSIALFRFFPVLLFICTGYCIGHAVNQISRTSILNLIIGLSGLTLALSVQFITNNDVNLHLFHFTYPVVFLFTGITGSIGLLFFCRWLCNIFSCRILSALGQNSLGIMLLHYPPFPTMAYAFVICGLLPELPSLLTWMISLVITTLLAYAATYFVKQKLLIK